MNNYGVWVDEFEAVGLAESLEAVYPQAICYFGEEQEVDPYCRCSSLGPYPLVCGVQVTIDRKYGRVNLGKLYEILLKRCQEAGVAFHSGFVKEIDTESNLQQAQIQCKDSNTAIKSKFK